MARKLTSSCPSRDEIAPRRGFTARHIYPLGPARSWAKWGTIRYDAGRKLWYKHIEPSFSMGSGHPVGVVAESLFLAIPNHRSILP